MNSFGSDPEFMLVDKNGKYVSAIKVLPGDKHTPVEIGEYRFYWDNVLAECSIKPGYSKEEVIENFRTCFKHYSKLVKPYKLKVQASKTFPAKQMRDTGAKTAGCDPEFCSYTILKRRPPAGIIEETYFRTCGGHIHLGDMTGCVVSDDEQTLILIRLLDLFLGIPSLYMDIDKTSAARRKLYGKAGRVRYKPYGIEYRSLGNFWLASPKLVSFVYDVCDFVINFTNNNQQFWKFDKKLFKKQGERYKNTISTDVYNEKAVLKCINTSDTNKAQKLMTFIKKYMPDHLYKQISELTRTYDFYKEWNLK